MDEAENSLTMDVICELSVIAPCFNEEQSLSEFHRRTRFACENLGVVNYEIVLVDDGSRDGTWQIIEDLTSIDCHVVGIKLMRNHGHQLAVTAGLAASRGERVLLIDADLQDPPELLPDMWELMDRGADVVYGQRKSREGETLFKRVTASIFYRFLARATDVQIPLDTGDFRLMSRQIVDMLNVMPERQRFIRGMISWIGGRQVPLPYDRKPRVAGATKYPLKKMILFAIDAFTSFSIMPLRIAFWFGMLFTIVAFLVLCYALTQWWLGGTVIGWTSLTAAVALFSGVQLAVLGVIGEYLGRLVQEAKGRPLYLVENVIGKSVGKRVYRSTRPTVHIALGAGRISP